MSAKPVESAGQLWSSIVERAGLNLDLYDGQLLEELAASLRLPTQDFAAALDREGVSVEELLAQFLSLIEPYAGMMRDVLALFTRASARSSDENLRIRFDFDEARRDFELDLRNFREWERRLEAVVGLVQVFHFGTLDAYELRHAFVVPNVTYRIELGRWVDLEPPDERVLHWLAEGGRAGAISPLPPPPAASSEELRALLRQAWAVLQSDDAVLTPADVRTIVRGAYLLAPSDPDLAPRLRELFARLPSSEVEMPVVLERLDEILNLPAWQRREELYSVWVGSRLIEALGGEARVHQVEGAISFSFRGSHLATLRLASSANVHVWSELQTLLTAAKPVGKGRKLRIQPDYVLSGEPLTDSRSSLLVVECKQYLQQKKRNFSDALVDYARGHPNAKVLLVNYGPTTSTVLERVAEIGPDVRGRTYVLGKFRPGSPGALEDFDRLVQEVVPPRVGPVASDRPSGPVEALWAAEGSITLTWGATPRDLDIHGWVDDSRGHQGHVFYDNRRCEIEDSLLELDADVTDGFGPETLHWATKPDASLVFAAHNYSGEQSIAGCGARVEASIGGSMLELEAPSEGVGRWWHLFAVDASSGRLTLKNVTTASPPKDPGNE